MKIIRFSILDRNERRRFLSSFFNYVFKFFVRERAHAAHDFEVFIFGRGNFRHHFDFDTQNNRLRAVDFDILRVFQVQVRLG